MVTICLHIVSKCDTDKFRFNNLFTITDNKGPLKTNYKKILLSMCDTNVIFLECL